MRNKLEKLILTSDQLKSATDGLEKSMQNLDDVLASDFKRLKQRISECQSNQGLQTTMQ